MSGFPLPIIPGVEPYHVDEKAGIIIYCGDCLDLLPKIPKGMVDLVLTDPPYPDHEKYGWEVPDLLSWPEYLLSTHGFIFWAGMFPLEFTARHIWAKANRNVGTCGELYEEFYEINGSKTGLVMRHAVIDCPMNATLNGDSYFDHPCQKPIRLVRRIVRKTDGTILDSFMGSGTTLVAAKLEGRRAIGIEIEEKYCEIAKRRLQATQLGFVKPGTLKPKLPRGFLG